MKHIITLLAAFALAVAANAQNDSLVVFDTKGDNLGISVAGFNISLGEDKDTAQKKPKTVKRVTTNFAGISFGRNTLAGGSYYGNWADQGHFLTDHAMNWRFGVEAFGISVSLDRQRSVFLKVSLNSTTEIFRFNAPISFVNDQQGNLMPCYIDGTFKKSKMVAAYLGAGTGLNFKISKVLLGMNFNVDMLNGSYVKYKNPGKVKYDISGLNNIRYRTGMSATLDGFGIFVDYCFTPVFRTGNDGKILSIGLCMGF